MMNEYKILLRKSPEEMWRDDLEELIKRMRIIEKMSQKTQNTELDDVTILTNNKTDDCNTNEYTDDSTDLEDKTAIPKSETTTKKIRRMCRCAHPDVDISDPCYKPLAK